MDEAFQEKPQDFMAETALKALNNGDDISALVTICEAIATSPANLQYRVIRFDCLYQLKEYDLALADALQIISIDRCFKLGYHKALDCYIVKGETSNANDLIGAFNKLHMNDDYIENIILPKLKKLDKLQHDITALWALNKYSECLENVSEALTISSDHNKLQLKKLRILVAIGEFEAAENMNINILSDKRRHTQRDFLAALKFYYNGNFQKSSEITSKILEEIEHSEEIIEIFKNSRRFNEGIANGDSPEYLLGIDPSNETLKKKLMSIKGRKYMEHDDFDSAILHFSASLANDPRDVEALHLRAKCYCSTEQYPKALHDCRSLLKLNVGRGELRNCVTGLKGEICEILNLPLDPFDNLSRDTPKNDIVSTPSCQIQTAWELSRAKLKAVKGMEAFKAGNYQLAWELFSNAILLHPKNQKYIQNRYECLMMVVPEKFKDALADAKAMMKLNATSWKWHSNAIKINIMLGYDVEAEKIINELSSNNVDFDHSELSEINKKLEILKQSKPKIEQLYAECNYTECLVALEEAVKIATVCKSYESKKAECLVMIGRYEEAEKMVNLALARKWRRGDMLYVLGLKFLYEGNLFKSIQSFDKALKLYPSHVKANNYREIAKVLDKYCASGMENLKEKRFLAAKEAYTKALIVDPTNKMVNSQMLYFRGSANYELKHYSAAYEDLTETLKINEAHAKALAKRAQTHFKLNEYEDCVIDCEESLKIEESKIIQHLLIEAKSQVKNCPKQNPHQVLSVPLHASTDEIKKSFKKLSLKYHSDKNPTATRIDKKKLNRKFQEVKESYDFLMKKKLS